eukprot:scaffold277958_cov28-Tisochrysis_lutea.AAC.1
MRCGRANGPATMRLLRWHTRRCINGALTCMAYMPDYVLSPAQLCPQPCNHALSPAMMHSIG